MTKEILLIRHTTPEIQQGICYGQLNLDVADTFQDESGLIQNSINGYRPQAVFSSPLKRCSILASSLFPKHNIEMDDRLMEINFGDWEGEPWDNFERAIMDRWAKDFIDLRPPNGESFKELILRSETFMEQILNTNNEKIAVVTHSGVIRSILTKYLHIPPQSIFNLHLNYGCIVKISIKGSNYHQVEFVKG